MSLIKNLVKEPEKKPKKDDDDETEKTERPIIKSATDLQRLKIEKLMKNPEKPVQIPDYASREARRNREIEPPSFVRNVMGSSAGAGSGEFHVYRHLRRKEYARQKGIQIKSLTEQRDLDYHEKLEENRRIAEEKTAKKRAKRLKKKQRSKNAKKSKPNQTQTKQSENDDTTDDDDEDDDNKAADMKQQPASDSSQAASIETAANDASTPKALADKHDSSQNNASQEQEDLNKVD